MLSLQEFSNGCISVSGIQKYPTRFENENRIMEELFSKADWASFGNEHQISTNKVEKNEFGQFCIWRESQNQSSSKMYLQKVDILHFSTPELKSWAKSIEDRENIA